MYLALSHLHCHPCGGGRADGGRGECVRSTRHIGVCGGTLPCDGVVDDQDVGACGQLMVLQRRLKGGKGNKVGTCISQCGSTSTVL